MADESQQYLKYSDAFLKKFHKKHHIKHLNLSRLVYWVLKKCDSITGWKRHNFKEKFEHDDDEIKIYFDVEFFSFWPRLIDSEI